MDNKTITVNGTVYDAVTGMPTGVQTSGRGAATFSRKEAKPFEQIHRRTEVARTQNRRTPAPIQIQKRTPRTIQPQVAKSEAVTRFAPQPSKTQGRARSIDDIQPATIHPLAQKAERRLQQRQSSHVAASLKPSTVLKNEAIDEALEKAPRHGAAKPIKAAKRSPRMLHFASMALSLLLLTGYLTYINLPNLSVRVAANQAGINASYPSYRPDGYRLAGVNYDAGSVSLKFAANAGPQNFTITQERTSWDSTAVKENYVKSNWGDNVIPYSERGLTIYSHEGNAAWVNGGILYTITGDAPLSASQVRSIATSL